MNWRLAVIVKELRTAALDPMSLISDEVRLHMVLAADELDPVGKGTVKVLRDALEPFAALATEAGRAPNKLDSCDPGTTEGSGFDDSSDEARFAILIKVGAVRRAKAAIE